MTEVEAVLMLDRDGRDEWRSAATAPRDDLWVARLRTPGAGRDQAVAALRDLMVRAARHQVGRMSEAAELGWVRRDEIIQSAADEATMAVLARLDSFEGRSRFTTWAYKFGILQAGVEVRRARWRGREVDLHDAPETAQPTTTSPEAYAEAGELAQAVREALDVALTPHQRRVAIALLVDEVPIDVLTERLGTNRNALYKTLHDARQRLRRHLAEEGFLAVIGAKDVT